MQERSRKCARCDALRDAIEKTHALAMIWFCVQRNASIDATPRRHRALVEAILNTDAAGISEAVHEHLEVGTRHTLERLGPYFRLHGCGSRRFSRAPRPSQ